MDVYVENRLLKILVLVLSILLLTGLAGCSTLTPEEAEYREAEIAEGYRLCYEAKRQAGIPWISTGKTAMDVKLGRTPTGLDAKRELIDNQCIRWLRAQGFDL